MTRLGHLFNALKSTEERLWHSICWIPMAGGASQF